MSRFGIAAITAALMGPLPVEALDLDGDQQSDVWEMVFGAAALPPGADQDGDGWSNAAESTAGTNPFAGGSHPSSEMVFNPGPPRLEWSTVAGKQYTVLSWISPASMVPLGEAEAGTGGVMDFVLPNLIGREFFRLMIEDADTDLDGVNDWEELVLGFDPEKNRSERLAQTDLQRVTSGLNAANTITAAVYDDTCSERWPDAAVLVVRRGGGLQPLTVNLSLTGSAGRNTDYQASIPGNTVSFSAGQREVHVAVSALTDTDDGEPGEAVVLTILPGAGYTAPPPKPPRVF
jgi:hypothetical protein